MELNFKNSSVYDKRKPALTHFIALIIISLCMCTYQKVNAATFINGMYYELNATDYTASLAGATYNFGGYSGDVVIPSSVVYEGMTYTVTTIKDKCFYNCKDITSLTIPSTVNNIAGTNVFYGCTGIKRVILEDGDTPITIPGCRYSTDWGNTKATFHFAELESIYVGRTIKMESTADYDSPFYNQPTMTEVIIGPKVSELPMYFIYRSTISNIIIPEGVKKIGENAFASMPNIQEIVFPNSLEEIGKYCCSSSNLEKVFLGNNVKVLESTFAGCTNLNPTLTAKIFFSLF